MPVRKLAMSKGSPCAKPPTAKLYDRSQIAINAEAVASTKPASAAIDLESLGMDWAG